MNKDISLGRYSYRSKETQKGMNALKYSPPERFSYVGTTWLAGREVSIQMVYADPDRSDFGLFSCDDKIFIVANGEKIEIEDGLVVVQMLRMLKKNLDQKTESSDEE